MKKRHIDPDTADAAGRAVRGQTGTSPASDAVSTVGIRTTSIGWVPRRLGRRSVGRLLSGRAVVGVSFVLPFAVLAAVFALMQFFPVGDKTPLTIDLYHQYAPFLVELRDKMTGSFNLFYSWTGGLGHNFYAQMAYYLASPLNLLLYLFPAAWVTEAVTVLTLLKVGACGAAFSNFLRHACCFWGRNTVSALHPAEQQPAESTATNYAIVLTSAFYALSGFVLTYSWDIMWLDVVAIMPLMMLGMHRLIRDGRFVLYTLSLAGALVFNYYIALFVCLFTVVYYPVCYVSMSPYLKAAQHRPVRHFLKRTGQIAGASLLGAGISAVLTLPTYLSLQLTSATTDRFPETWEMRFTLFDFLGRHMVDMPPSIRDNMPNIYTGVLTFALIPLYIGARHIRLGEKLAHLALLLFMFFSFNVNGLDFIWHGMHYPNQLPFRYSFVYCFLVLVMCFRAVCQIRSFSPRTIASAFGLGILYAILAEAVIPNAVDHESAYITIVLLVLYLVFVLLFAHRKEQLRTVAILVSIICVAELSVNAFMTVFTINKNEYYSSRQEFTGDISDVRQTIRTLEAADPDFWRMEVVQQKTTNSPSLYGYRGLTIFSSTSYVSTAKLMRGMGYHGNNINSYKYTASTAVLDAIMGLKYILNKQAEMTDPLLTLRSSDAGGHLYEFTEALPVGYMVSEQMLSWSAVDVNPFRNQSDFLAAAGAPAPVFRMLEIETDQLTGGGAPSGNAEHGYSLLKNGTGQMTVNLIMRAEADQHLYFYADPNGKATFSPTYQTAAGETGSLDAVTINEQELVDLGYRRKGDVITIAVKAEQDEATDVRYLAAALDEAALKRAVAQLREQALTITRFTDSRIEGAVQAQRNGYLFLSIPFDPSWRVRVDGEPADLVAAGGGLSMIPMAAGHHTVELSFMPPAFMVGLLITLASLFLMAACWLAYRMSRARRSARGEIQGFDFERLNADQNDGLPAGQAEFTADQVRPASDLPPDLPGLEDETAGRASVSADTGAAETAGKAPEPMALEDWPGVWESQTAEPQDAADASVAEQRKRRPPLRLMPREEQVTADETAGTGETAQADEPDGRNP